MKAAQTELVCLAVRARQGARPAPGCGLHREPQGQEFTPGPRHVNNLRDFFGKFAPALLSSDFGEEIWSLYVAGVLSNDYPLSGRFARTAGAVDLGGVLREIDDARAEDAARRLRVSA